MSAGIDHGAIFDGLLAFDDTPELLDLRFQHDRLLMWPFIRYHFYRSVVGALLGWPPAHAASEKRSIGQRLDYLARSVVQSPLSVRREFELVVFGTSAGTVIQRDGKWFDRINDYFTMEYPERTLAIDAGYRGIYKHPRFPPHTRCHDGIVLAGAIADRVRRVSAADDATIERLASLVSERFPIALPAGTLDVTRRFLCMWAARLPVLAPLYKRFFARVKPRMIFVEDAHYGGWSHILVWAREAGIATAEIQHGLVGRSHVSYNWGAKLQRDAELARYLPQHFLMYGPYWAEQVSTPAERVVIGCPHFAARRDELRRLPRPASPAILVISQGDRTARMVELTEALAAQLPERTIVFRPHQGEIPFVERYEHLRRLPNVQISDSGDLYGALAEADAVVGPASTALVEAEGCGLAVYIDDDEFTRTFLPERLGHRFTTAGELVELLRTGTRAPSQATSYWADDWQARYRAFVDRISGARDRG